MFTDFGRNCVQTGMDLRDADGSLGALRLVHKRNLQYLEHADHTCNHGGRRDLQFVGDYELQVFLHKPFGTTDLLKLILQLDRIWT